MIAKATKNKLNDIPLEINHYAFPLLDEEILDITEGLCYAVYGVMKNIDHTWYLVHTDNLNAQSFCWMPSELYKISDSIEPKEWINIDDDTRTFSALKDDRIYDGIIDGDKSAIDHFERQALADNTFPSKEFLAELNKPLLEKKQAKERLEFNKIAKSRGWELQEDDNTI
jgi:hypothetical protein